MGVLDYILEIDEIDIITTLQANTYGCLKIDRFGAFVSNESSKLTFGTYYWFKKNNVTKDFSVYTMLSFENALNRRYKVDINKLPFEYNWLREKEKTWHIWTV